MNVWCKIWIQGKTCIFCAEQWSDCYGSEKESCSQKRNENMRMNVDSEGGLRYTLFSDKRKKVTVHTGVYSNEKSAAHRSMGVAMKRLLKVRQRRSII